MLGDGRDPRTRIDDVRTNIPPPIAWQLVQNSRVRGVLKTQILNVYP